MREYPVHEHPLVLRKFKPWRMCRSMTMTAAAGAERPLDQMGVPIAF